MIRPPRLRRSPLAVVAIAGFAALWAVVGSAWIFPHLSANGDEGAYLLQAAALADGDLAPIAPAGEEGAFLPWFSVADTERGVYVTKYTPVHAGVLAAGQLVWSARLGLAALAAAQVLAVAALAYEVQPERHTVVFAALLFALAPLTIQLNITYLPYGTSLALGIGSVAAALRAVRLGSIRWGAVCGFVWGFGAFARPYDAVLWAIIGTAGVAAVHGWRRPLRLAPAAIAAAALPVGLLLAYNGWATGDVFQLPFNLLEPQDTLGFGPRRALPDDPTLDYDLSKAGRALVRNSFLIVTWTGGGLMAVAAALYAMVRKLGRSGAVLIGIVVVWPVGYLFFWGSYLSSHVWDGALFLGPYYYYPVTAAIAIAAPIGLSHARQAYGNWIPAAVGVMALLSFVVIIPALAEQRDRTSQRRDVARAIDSTVVEPALVFVPAIYGEYLQNPLSFLRNTPQLDGPIVYALDRDPDANERIVDRYPGRAIYRLQVGSQWSDQPGFDPDVSVTPID